eukprot:jgi/Picsp_1/2509/NSC_00740-R1_protein
MIRSQRWNVGLLERGGSTGKRGCKNVRLWCVKGEQQNTDSPKLVTLTIKKPLGIVLAENKDSGEVFVEEIVPNSNAANTKAVSVGDVLVATSATVLKAGKDGEYEREGYGQRPYDNWETVEFNCRGQIFDTVMAALGSNNSRWGINTITVTLEKRSGE